LAMVADWAANAVKATAATPTRITVFMWVLVSSLRFS
jgi:hypothetical protein